MLSDLLQLFIIFQALLCIGRQNFNGLKSSFEEHTYAHEQN